MRNEPAGGAESGTAVGDTFQPPDGGPFSALQGTLRTADSTPQRDYAALMERVRRAATPPLQLRVYGRQTAPDGGESYDMLLVNS